MIASTTRQISQDDLPPDETTSNDGIDRVLIDFEHRFHRLAVFSLGFFLIVILLVIMSKIYKTINTLKYRNKHYGYYINPKYETILVNLNRQIKSSGRSFVQNFKKTQFVRVKKYEDDTDSVGKATNEMVEDVEEGMGVLAGRYESGFVNEVFEMNESESDPRLSEEEEEEEEWVSKKQIVPSLITKGRIGSGFNYRRLGKCRLKKRSRLPQRTRKAARLCSYLVKKMKTNGAKKRPARNPSISETPSSMLKNVEFNLPVILVTDTTSMNTTIIDLEDI